MSGCGSSSFREKTHESFAEPRSQRERTGVAQLLEQIYNYKSFSQEIAFL